MTGKEQRSAQRRKYTMQGEFEEPGFPGKSGKGMVVLLLTNKGADA